MLNIDYIFYVFTIFNDEGILEQDLRVDFRDTLNNHIDVIYHDICGVDMDVIKKSLNDTDKYNLVLDDYSIKINILDLDDIITNKIKDINKKHFNNIGSVVYGKWHKLNNDSLDEYAIKRFLTHIVEINQ